MNDSKIFDRMILSDDSCFLCGNKLGPDRSREHVFPLWLQHRHDLLDKQLTLLNGTSIKYSQLTIPSCMPCNSEHLGTLENRVRTAIDSGYQEVERLPPIILYQWLGKIFYGLLRKEISLLVDRKDSSRGAIVPPQLMENFSTLHLFLQSIRQPFTFLNGLPFSVLVVNLYCPERQDEYFFRDNFNLMAVSIRTKTVGLIVSLQDAGIIHRTYGRYVAEVAGRKLNVLQFDELYAKCTYQLSLFTRTPSYAVASSHDPSVPTVVHQLPIGGLGSEPVSEEWVQADYVHFLMNTIKTSCPNIKINDLFVPPDKIMTWMSDENGKLRLFDEEGKPMHA